MNPAGVVVQVLGIRKLHFTNLQCGQRRMELFLGSGRSQIFFCGEKENQVYSILCEHGDDGDCVYYYEKWFSTLD